MLVDSHITGGAGGPRGAHPGDRHGPPRPAQRGRGADAAAPGGKIDIDFDTARRLFTLVCVLHQRIGAAAR